MTVAIVDERISEKCKRALTLHGFFPLTLPPDGSLGEAVASHPDTVMFAHSGEIVTTADYCERAAYVFSELRELTTSVKITFTADVRQRSYPHDCIMNALVIGNKVFAKCDTVAEAVKALAARRGLELINVRQGYPACTVLPLGDSAAITADRGMARVLSENGIRVTLIREGGISLPPHEYGFIGGASGVFGGKVYFFGDIMGHPDAEKIVSAIRAEGFQPVSLSNEPLRDLGGIVFAE